MERPETPDGEVEILHLKKRMELDGDIYDWEVSYLSDHQILHNFAKNGAWQGWASWKMWEKLDEVYATASLKKARGWEVTWNPLWQPGLREFIRQVNI